MPKRRAGAAAFTPPTKVSHHSVSASSSDATTKAIRLLVTAALETWCHHLLYVRRVYPSNSFANSYFLGLRVKANRHPAVVAYISRAVEAAVPALIGSRRVADEFSFEVTTEVRDSNDSVPASGTHQNRYEKKSEEASNIKGKETQSMAFSSGSSQKFTNTSEEREKAQKAPNNTQSSVSSLSTTAVQQQKQSQESEQKHNSQDSEEVATIIETAPRSSLGEGIASSQATTTSITANSQQQQQPLENISVQVLERFSLFFSAPLEPPHNVNDNTPKNSTCAGGGVVADIEDGAIRRNNNNNKKRKGANGTITRQENSARLMLSELEQAFRHLILNLSNVKRDRVPPCSSLSFKLVLHVNDHQQVCPEIEKAFDAGSWHPCSSETERVARERRPRLPLYEVDVDNCKIRFHMQRKNENSETRGS